MKLNSAQQRHTVRLQREYQAAFLACKPASKWKVFSTQFLYQVSQIYPAGVASWLKEYYNVFGYQ
jgi:hypothetical protein